MNQLMNLKILNQNLITLDSDYTLEETYLCDDVTLSLHLDTDKKYVLSYDCLQYSISTFRGMLQQALESSLGLHDSILLDVGLLWNEKANDDTVFSFEYEIIENTEHWVGLKNLLWSTPGNIKPDLSTWLYNDKNGNIIFEVTPTYHWHYSDPEPDDKDYITYEEFMKNYKPLIIKQIPKDVANEWLSQVNELLKFFEAKLD